ncbi:hypothetical protein NE637_08335 [Desulfovibrio desulfuricans]|uniref:structural cement protein Gp24 n=1 Tax=Desulfovibrio desulfuricans TaxID=876 RepID=UPI00210F0700|nr:hypothetical protein [Desulfovibrio desulfuricans]MCQ4861155.1 hypothetical protein [Desulfovibrio desulfuricans]
MSNAYLKRMPAGIPGDVSRKAEATVEAGLMGEAVAFGAPVKMDGGRLVALSGASDAVYGFVVRPYPTMGSAAASGSIQDVLRRGYMTVKLTQGTSAKGGQVYVRHTAETGKAVGDIEAAAVEGKNLAVPGCLFMGEADSSGNVEISFNL